ncbi:sensor histidine kinase [Salidesulfovibrio brasiliensis]|uniref:sensor histidine kinase n=1 Tax=Salidesulfovibrio brasiliensis TaxID=221711 RepID=UPI0006D220F1|nr:PAS domain-containing sensor histidine kinase [Salidesulfovibrio brasiliensis]
MYFESPNGSDTEFLPPDVLSREDVARQAQAIKASGAFCFSDYIPFGLMVLNDHRQAVFANRGALRMIDAESAADVVGKRPGTIFRCIHANSRENGCGTTVFCRECGAANAIKSSLGGTEAQGECRMLCERGDGPEAVDLRVTAAPYVSEDGEQFTVFSLEDISADKRRRVLERVFFHDILNHAGGLRGMAQFIAGNPGSFDEEIASVMAMTLEKLLNEILAHKDLTAAESGELHPVSKRIHTVEHITNVARVYRKHVVAEDKRVVVDPASVDVSMDVDPVLLNRVIGNMVKNALEASVSGEAVTIGCREEQGAVVFSVHNPGVMPEKVKRQVFKRSFSTKGVDRGLGTYSILLLGEKYLGGKVGFSSDEGFGTEFRIALPV